METSTCPGTCAPGEMRRYDLESLFSLLSFMTAEKGGVASAKGEREKKKECTRTYRVQEPTASPHTKKRPRARTKKQSHLKILNPPTKCSVIVSKIVSSL